MTESFPSGGRRTKRFLLPCRGLEGAFPCRIQIDRKTQKRPRSSPMRMSSLRRSETAAHFGSGPGRIIPHVRPADRGDRRTGFARSVFLFDCPGMTLQRCAGFSVSSPSFFSVTRRPFAAWRTNVRTAPPGRAVYCALPRETDRSAKTVLPSFVVRLTPPGLSSALSFRCSDARLLPCVFAVKF